MKNLSQDSHKHYKGTSVECHWYTNFLFTLSSHIRGYDTKSPVCWNMVPSSPLKVNRCFIRICRLYLQGQWISQTRNPHEAGSFAYSSTLKMKVTRTSKMLIDFQWTTLHHIPDDRTLPQPYCLSEKSQMYKWNPNLSFLWESVDFNSKLRKILKEEIKFLNGITEIWS
jgi:hypothetical protein